MEELARRHPTRFSVLTLPTFRPAPFHWAIGDALLKVMRGEITRLIVNLPPRHGKSEQCSIRFPAFYLGSLPMRNFIVGSYAASLATHFGRKARNIVSSPVFKRAFPGVSFAKDVGAAGAHWALNNGSEFVAAGVGGGITGKGADVLGIDDPIKNSEQAASALYRENLKDWYRNVALTRLTPKGAVIIPMTRWHHHDLCGWLIDEWKDEEFTVLRYPAIQDRDPVWYDPRKPGEALWPERYPLSLLQQRREEIGPVAFNGLYQQTPTLSEGAVLKLEWIKQDFDLTMLPDFTRVIVSWDTAFEKHDRADYSVGTVWGDTGTDYYLLEVVRGRWTFPELKRMMLATQMKWNSSAVLVEKAASGRDILHELRQESDLPLIAVTVDADKVRRADAVSGRFEAGRVHAPRYAPWLADYFQEIEQFPNGQHDDQVDSTTQGIKWLTRHSGQEAVAA